jgi:hypothetical protein
MLFEYYKSILGPGISKNKLAERNLLIKRYFSQTSYSAKVLKKNLHMI